MGAADAVPIFFGDIPQVLLKNVDSWRKNRYTVTIRKEKEDTIMKNCPVCNAQLNDDAVFCTQCGAPQQQAQQPGAEQAGQAYTAPQNNYNPYAAPVYSDPYDHTAEMDPQDISENKVFAMCVYLLGWIGIVIALLASRDSKYIAFHVRQALKIEVTSIISVVMAIVPILGWIAFAVCAVILLVLRIIAFFQICSGKAKEPAIVRSLGFLK